MPGQISISERELKVLVALDQDFSSEYYCWLALYFRTIAERSGIEPHLVRRVVRSLARKGLAQYERGLFTEDGMTAGSGYRCTQAGHDFLIARNGAAQTDEAA